MIALLGSPAEAQRLPARYLFLDDVSEPVVSEGELTWYDSRASHPTRSEPRLYYRHNEAVSRMAEGDLLVLGRLQSGSMLALIARAGSSVERQVEWLFGLGETGSLFKIIGEEAFDRCELQFSARAILDALGIESFEVDERYLDLMFQHFGGQFPTTRAFSEFARKLVGDVPIADNDPDSILLEWMEKEEVLFRTLEKYHVEVRIKEGFSEVDEFMSYSLSVQNRRKARAGSALENHLEAIFAGLDIQYSRSKVTERTSRPDFIFPGIDHYRDPSCPAGLLTMLAAKSTCKDRWRQIIPEADRIARKHLLTLEPAISENQTTEMRDAEVSLVVPAPLHGTYRPSQRSWLLSLGQFLGIVRAKQSTYQARD